MKNANFALITLMSLVPLSSFAAESLSCKPMSCQPTQISAGDAAQVVCGLGLESTYQVGLEKSDGSIDMWYQTVNSLKGHFPAIAKGRHGKATLMVFATDAAIAFGLVTLDCVAR